MNGTELPLNHAQKKSQMDINKESEKMHLIRPSLTRHSRSILEATRGAKRLTSGATTNNPVALEVGFNGLI